MREQYDKYPELKGLPLEERMSEYYRAYRRRNPEKILFNAARDRAKKKGLEFNLEISDIKIPDHCPILGIKIKSYSGRGTPGGKPDSPSLDRIDNSQGYVKGNIQIISHMANSMKFTANPEELLRFADWINKTYAPLRVT